MKPNEQLFARFVNTREQKIYQAMQYGITHGYDRRPGGWIYPSTSATKPLCQGWMKFYESRQDEIDRWWQELWDRKA